MPCDCCRFLRKWHGQALRHSAAPVPLSHRGMLGKEDGAPSNLVRNHPSYFVLTPTALQQCVIQTADRRNCCSLSAVQFIMLQPRQLSAILR